MKLNSVAVKILRSGWACFRDTKWH